MNDVGDIITRMEIQGPGITDDNKALMWIRHHVVQRWIPLLQGNDSIDGRIVSATDFDAFGYWDGTGGADGLPQSLNDLGMLAMVLEFTDASRGVYRIAPPVFGDADQDGDLDLADYSLMSNCLAGPDSGIAPDCEVFDLDADSDVDIVDYNMLQQLFTGEGT